MQGGLTHLVTPDSSGAPTFGAAHACGLDAHCTNTTSRTPEEVRLGASQVAVKGLPTEELVLGEDLNPLRDSVRARSSDCKEHTPACGQGMSTQQQHQ